jgi:hypothetical protein
MHECPLPEADYGTYPVKPGREREGSAHVLDGSEGAAL